MEAILESATALLGNLALRATLVLAGAVAVAWLLRRRSASLRHLLWTGTVGALLLLPLAAALLPPLGLPVKPAPRPAKLLDLPPAPPTWPPPPWVPAARTALLRPAGKAVQGEPARRPPHRQARWPPALAVAWALGALLVMARFGRARVQARRLVAGSRAADPAVWPRPAGVDLREGESIDLPMTVGALRPVILMPTCEGRRWSAGWRAAAVQHEVAHLRRRDPLVEAAAELACCLYWFHPLAWLAARQLRTERELAADDDVLAGGVAPPEYAELLVTLGCLPAVPPETGAVLPMLTPAGLKTRLLGILDGRRRRGLGRWPALALAAAGMGLFLPTASAVLVARAPERSGPGVVLACARDEGTHEPVAGAEIDVWDMMSLDDHQTTGPDGCFRWWHQPEPSPRGGLVVYARRGNLAGRQSIVLATLGTPLPATIDMRPGLSVSGVVVDERSRPLPGTTVRMMTSETWSRGPGPGATAVSRGDGSFQLDGLLYGQFRLLFESPDGGLTTAFVNLDQKSISDLEIIMPQPQRVTGYLQDEAGRPVAGARIEEHEVLLEPTTRQIRGRHVDWDVSDADGAFRLAFVGRVLRATGRDGAGRLVMTTFGDWDRPPRLQSGTWYGGHPMDPRTLVLKRAEMIGGTVRLPDGRPAAHVAVHGMVSSGPRDHTMIESQTRAQTDDQGRFWVGPFPLATVSLSAVAPPAGPDGLLGDDAEVLVTGEETPHVDLVLRHGWRHPMTRGR